MTRSDRHRSIIRAVSGGPRTIDDLARLTGVAAVTVRRDLAELADQGVLVRTRGGAAPLVSRGADYPFGLRADEHVGVKQALAHAVVAMIGPGDSVVVDNGTTALAVAHGLAGRGVTAMALSLHAAAALAARPGNEVVVPGGPVGQDDLAFTGSGAADAVRAMRFDVAVLGACAADPRDGLTVAGWGDAHVKRAMIASARRSVLVATAEKFARTAAHRVAEMADLDTVVTTDDVPAAILHELRVAGVEVRTVPAESDQSASN